MRDLRAPTQAGASRTREGAEEDKGKEGRGGRSGTCRFKGAEGRSGVGGCARGTRLHDGLRGVVCAGLLFWAPTPSKTFQSRSEKWGLQAILGTRALSSRWSGFTLHPLRADRWFVCAFPQPARLSAPTRAGLCRQDPPLRFWTDWRGLFFVFCPARELPRRPGLLAPWAWESQRLGNGTRRGSHRGHSARAEARSCGAAVREFRGSEASTRPVSGPDTAMDPG